MRLEIKKTYDEKIRSLEERCKNYDSLTKELKAEKDKVLELEKELRQKEEWINHMLEYCNMTEEELSAEKLNLEAKVRVAESMDKMSTLFGIFGRHL